MTHPDDGRRRGVTISSREVPQLRRCLADGHNHYFLTIRAIRLCPRGRDALRSLDPIYGGPSGLNLRSKQSAYQVSGIAAYATETT